MAATDELSVGRGRAEQIAARAIARVEARRPRRARLVAAIVSSAAFAVVSVTGVGAIADQAVPGDSLYPVDRAYESISRAIGRDVDRTQETLEEALVLAQRGDKLRAVNHVNVELGQQTPVVEAIADDVVTETTPVATSAPVPVDDPGEPSAPVAAVEPPPATVPEAVSAGESETTEAPAEEVELDEPANDPFVLALQNAIRASQAAATSEDAQTALAANEAVQSVVKLAAGELDVSEELQQAAPGAVTVVTTTTTSVPEETAAADVEDVQGEDQVTSTTVEDPQSPSTTTTVPSEDSEEQPPGDGETAGDDSGGSQEGSGIAGESGDEGEEPPGPVILPIP